MSPSVVAGFRMRTLFAKRPRVGWFRRLLCRVLSHRDERWEGTAYVVPWTGQSLTDDRMWDGVPGSDHTIQHCTRCGAYRLPAPAIPVGKPMAVRFVYITPEPERIADVEGDLDIRVAWERPRYDG